MEDFSLRNYYRERRIVLFIFIFNETGNFHSFSKEGEKKVIFLNYFSIIEEREKEGDLFFLKNLSFNFQPSVSGIQASNSIPFLGDD